MSKQPYAMFSNMGDPSSDPQPAYPSSASPVEAAPAYPAGSYPTGAVPAYTQANRMSIPTTTSYPVFQQPNVVVVNQPQPQYLDIERPPANYLIMSCLVFWLANCCCGGIALLFSFLSMSANSGGHKERARIYGKASLGLNITGLIITGLLFTIIMVINQYAEIVLHQ